MKIDFFFDVVRINAFSNKKSRKKKEVNLYKNYPETLQYLIFSPFSEIDHPAK